MRARRYEDTIYVSTDVEGTDVEVEISIDEIIDQIDDETIREMYEDVFGKPDNDWQLLYEKRRQLSDQEFLKVIDKAIMDVTGRIL